MGDSYWAGEGASKTSAYANRPGMVVDGRHQSGYAPPHVAWMLLEAGRRPLIDQYRITPASLQTSWGPDRLQFNASSGASTRHLVQQQKESNGDIRNEPQLDGVDPNTNIAFFGLGGNDAGFFDVVSTATKAGAFSSYPEDPSAAIRQQETVQQVILQKLRGLSTVADNIMKGLHRTHLAMPLAEIIVGLYPIGVKPTGNADLAAVGHQTLDVLYSYVKEVNATISKAAAAYQRTHPGVRVHVFDPNTAGPGGTSVVAGHEVGQPDSYFNDLKKNSGESGSREYQESYHPNELGAVAIGRALATWMAKEFPQYFPKGPNPDAIIMDPQASTTDPADVDHLRQVAQNDPDELCDGTDPDSICRFIQPGGDVIIPDDVYFNPTAVQPFPDEAPDDTGVVPGAPQQYVNGNTVYIPWDSYWGNPLSGTDHGPWFDDGPDFSPTGGVPGGDTGSGGPNSGGPTSGGPSSGGPSGVLSDGSTTTTTGGAWTAVWNLINTTQPGPCDQYMDNVWQKASTSAIKMRLSGYDRPQVVQISYFVVRSATEGDTQPSDPCS
ncbi:SGNH/GDSL hydrolase family protein [Sphaerisporangium rhizosphaerae]|uniref:SGNH hydrolase-type esterase domain-containing protein n=1 Tax=Sphaerisporangium rhizosphaerae TaxID=2269375 RepID=A0ABW2P0W0_9ACTN